MDPLIQSGAERQLHIEAAKAAFFMRGKSVSPADSFATKPPPARRDWIDPATVLQRKRARLRPSESRIIRQIAEAI